MRPHNLEYTNGSNIFWGILSCLDDVGLCFLTLFIHFFEPFCAICYSCAAITMFYLVTKNFRYDTVQFINNSSALHGVVYLIIQMLIFQFRIFTYLVVLIEFLSIIQTFVHTINLTNAFFCLFLPVNLEVSMLCLKYTKIFFRNKILAKAMYTIYLLIMCYISINVMDLVQFTKNIQIWLWFYHGLFLHQVYSGKLNIFASHENGIKNYIALAYYLTCLIAVFVRSINWFVCLKAELQPLTDFDGPK